jgi:hypothetical protein
MVKVQIDFDDETIRSIAILRAEMMLPSKSSAVKYIVKEYLTLIKKDK